MSSQFYVRSVAVTKYFASSGTRSARRGPFAPLALANGRYYQVDADLGGHRRLHGVRRPPADWSGTIRGRASNQPLAAPRSRRQRQPSSRHIPTRRPPAGASRGSRARPRSSSASSGRRRVRGDRGGGGRNTRSPTHCGTPDRRETERLTAAYRRRLRLRKQYASRGRLALHCANVLKLQMVAPLSVPLKHQRACACGALSSRAATTVNVKPITALMLKPPFLCLLRLIRSR